MNDALHLALDAAGAISVGAHPELKNLIDRAVKLGRLVRLLPGTYARGTSVEERICAVAAWDPDSVILGSAAARVGWWPGLDVGDVAVSTKRRVVSGYRGFDLRRVAIPDSLVWEHHGFRLASPAASVIQMIPLLGASAIDEGLRRRVVTVASLRWTLRQLPGRGGNVRAHRLLEESRDEPWSYLERQAHQCLRAHGIKGWRANYRVSLPGGSVFLDVALPAEKLAFEFDGWQYHRTRDQFAADRRRDIELQLAGWRVFRFTDDSMDRFPEVALRLLGRRAG